MIRMFSPHIPKEAGEKVAEVINSGWINRGKKAKEFEDKFMSMFGM